MYYSFLMILFKYFEPIIVMFLSGPPYRIAGVGQPKVVCSALQVRRTSWTDISV